MNVVFLGNGTSYANEASNALNQYKYKHKYIYNCKKKLKIYPKNYDLGISFLYQHLVPAEEIEKATWINFHPAPLPDYGGRNVAYHAIINNEKQYGATIHYMDQTFDTGDLIEVSQFDILENHTAYDIFHYSCVELLKLFRKYIPLLLSGELPIGTAQNSATYYKKGKIDDFIVLSEKTIKEILSYLHKKSF